MRPTTTSASKANRRADAYIRPGLRDESTINTASACPRRDEVVPHLQGQQDRLRDLLSRPPAHLQECFSYLGYREGDFPESRKGRPTKSWRCPSTPS